MTPEEFARELQRKEADIRRACERTIPLRVSVAMEEHTKDNFRQGGYVDGGLHPWKSTLRQAYGVGEDRARTPLLSRERNLMNNTRHRYIPYQASVYNNTPYASYHNQGATTTVTERMKGFFWARYKETKAEMYKFLALKPVGSKIVIPQRRFMGESAELTQKVEKIIDEVLTSIIKL